MSEVEKTLHVHRLLALWPLVMRRVVMAYRRPCVCRRTLLQVLDVEVLEARRVLSRAAAHAEAFDPPSSHADDKPSHVGGPWAERDVRADDAPPGWSVAVQHV